jgi:hypothetical protein
MAKLNLAIGECKTRKSITEQDVNDLKVVAEAFPTERFNVYFVLSKLGEFSAEEIERAKGLNQGFTQRAVLLSVEDLEPHLVYERAIKNPQTKTYHRQL